MRPAVRIISVRRLSTQQYHEVADDCLESILAAYESLSEKVPEVDVELSQGVLSLELPNLGAYVINKQPPNKQIWLASPVSGPKRFDYIDDKWVYARDKTTLGAILRSETLQAVNQELGLDLE